MSDQVKCDGCEAASSTLFCEQCGAYYCSACDATAHAVKNSRNHVRVSANAMQQGRVNLCATHNGKRADLFCRDCNEAICLLCRDYGSHASHNVNLIENTTQHLRDVLSQQVQNVSSLTTTAKDTLAKVDVALAELAGGTSEASKRAINKHFDQVLQALDDRKKELLQQVDTLVLDKETQLKQQASNLKASVVSGNKRLDEIRTACQLDDFSVCDAYAETMDALTNLRKSAPDQLIPIADMNVPMSFDDIFLETIRHHGSVGGPLRVRFADGNKGVCTVEWDPPLNSETRSWASYHVKARMLSKAVDVDESAGSGWVKVGGVLEKQLAVVPASKHELTVVVSEYPGATLEFLVMAVDKAGRTTAWSASPQKLRLPETFAQVILQPSGQPFSKRDLFYYLGTNGGQRDYVNPHVAGDVAVTWSSVGGGNIEQFVEIEPGTDFCFTEDKPDSWMCVDLGATRLLRPSAYSLRHDAQGPRGVLRNWLLQGKVGEHDEWTSLSAHMEDGSLRCNAGSVCTFPIDDSDLGGFRYFRVLQTGRNSSEKNRLLCAGLELFGTLF